MSSENPVKPGLGHIDTIVTNMCLPFLKFWHSIGAVPNTLTTFGLICSGLCIYNLYNNNINLAIIFLIFRWYFDFSDGLLARKYDQKSTFGDWYDHIVDVTFTILFVIVVYMKSKNRNLHLSLLTIFGMLMLVNFGCVEKKYHNDKDKESSISRLRKLCFQPEVISFFDNSTVYLIMIFIIITINKTEIFPNNKVNS